MFVHRVDVTGEGLLDGDEVQYDEPVDDRSGRPKATKVQGGTGGETWGKGISKSPEHNNPPHTEQGQPRQEQGRRRRGRRGPPLPPRVPFTAPNADKEAQRNARADEDARECAGKEAMRISRAEGKALHEAEIQARKEAREAAEARRHEIQLRQQARATQHAQARTLQVSQHAEAAAFAATTVRHAIEVYDSVPSESRTCVHDLFKFHSGEFVHRIISAARQSNTNTLPDGTFVFVPNGATKLDPPAFVARLSEEHADKCFQPSGYRRAATFSQGTAPVALAVATDIARMALQAYASRGHLGDYGCCDTYLDDFLVVASTTLTLARMENIAPRFRQRSTTVPQPHPPQSQPQTQLQLPLQQQPQPQPAPQPQLQPQSQFHQQPQLQLQPQLHSPQHPQPHSAETAVRGAVDGGDNDSGGGGRVSSSGSNSSSGDRINFQIKEIKDKMMDDGGSKGDPHCLFGPCVTICRGCWRPRQPQIARPYEKIVSSSQEVGSQEVGSGSSSSNSRSSERRIVTEVGGGGKALS